MATAATIKKNIAKLEAALKSKATPKSLKPKLETQLVKSKAELSGMNKGTKPKTSSTKSTQTALQKLKAMVNKNKKYKTYKGAGVDLEKDADRPALRTGKRVTDGTHYPYKKGNTYYEYRANRIDVKQPPKKYPKLEKGGYMADGGVMDVVNTEVIKVKGNIMGTTSLELKIKGMRKPQDFIVYPISADQAGKPITIQSDTRFGYLDLSSGRGLMSQSHSNGAYSYNFSIDKKVPFKISETDVKKIKEHLASKSGSKVGNSVIFSDNSGAAEMAKGGSIRTLYKQFNQEKPNILLIMIADDVASDFMREKFDKTVDWSKLSDSEKEKYNEDYRVNKTSFENYLMSEFVKLYYSDDSIKEKCKGSSHKTIDSIKSVMKDLAKKYPQDKYAKGGEMAQVNKMSKDELKNWLSENYGFRGVDGKGITKEVKDRTIENMRKEVLSQMKYNEKNNIKYADGGMSQDEESILVYYVNHYPEDELALEIKAKATFNGLYEVLSNKGDAYEYIGVADSIVRERVFEKLAKIKGVKYDVIYDMWMDSDYAKGGYMAKGGGMADGGETAKFQVDDVVYNKKHNTIGIVRIGESRGEVKTDADGNVDVDDLEYYNPLKHEAHKNAKVAPSTFKEVEERSLWQPFSERASQLAKGGFVGKGELVWRKLTNSKKMEFLKENFTPQITPRSQEILVGKDFQFLPKDVKIKLESKYANVEEYAKGGMSQKDVAESNAEMVLSQIKAVKHHAQELSNVVSKNSDIEAWVVAKIERASTDLSDITHYLEFQTKKMAMGGEIHRTQD